MTAPLLVIAAGGTGGHMFPAQALAEVMLARGWRVKLSTDARGARYTGGFPEAVEIQQALRRAQAKSRNLKRERTALEKELSRRQLAVAEMEARLNRLRETL